MKRIGCGRSAAWYVCIALVCVACPAGADDGVKLRWKLVPETSYEVAMIQDTNQTVWLASKPFESKSYMRIDSRWNIGAVDPTGKANVEQAFERVRATMQSLGQNITIDTDKPPTVASPQSAQLVQIYYDMIGPACSMTIDPSGVIGDVELLGNLKALSRKFAGTALGQQMSAESLKAMMTNPVTNNLLPAEPVAPGATWARQSEISVPMLGEQQISLQCTYVGVEEVEGKAMHKIDFAVEFKALETDEDRPFQLDIKRQKSQGTALFDHELGLMSETRSVTTMSINAVLEGQSFRQDLTSDVVTRFTPAAGQD